MFRNRNNSQQPNKELYSDFKRSYPDPSCWNASPLLAATQKAWIYPFINQIGHSRLVKDSDIKDHGLAISKLLDQWEIISAPLDLSSLSTSTSRTGGMAAASDPIFLPTPGPFLANPGVVDPRALQLKLCQLQFNETKHVKNPPADPDSFVLQNSEHGPVDRHSDLNAHVNQPQSREVAALMPGLTEHIDLDINKDNDKFRYNVTLCAPTAMVEHKGEVPITYLSKGHVYHMSVVDSTPPKSSTHPIKYRTYVHVAFEDPEKRLNPDPCWQLWKERRGLSEASRRGGKVQAVEYINPNQGRDRKARPSEVELETTSLNGFCVSWTSCTEAKSIGCTILIRLNFLSTDFNLAKGVKGVPVRLCVRTEMVYPANIYSALDTMKIYYYCKVKVFRDYGAERKLSNDIAHVRKAIHKLQQRISHEETKAHDFGKRKRDASSMAIEPENRPAKISKNYDAKARSGKERLLLEVAMKQDMISSTSPVSLLNLREDNQDTVDFSAAFVLNETQKSESELFTHQADGTFLPTIYMEAGTLDTSSSTPRDDYVNSPLQACRREQSTFRNSSIDVDFQHVLTDWSRILRLRSENQLLTDQYAESFFERLNGRIEAVDIDATCSLSSRHLAKSVACFYVRLRHTDIQNVDGYYHAVYIAQRTVTNLLNSISKMSGVSLSEKTRVFHITPNGLKVIIDDRVVQELPEGQDMTAEFVGAHNVDIDLLSCLNTSYPEIMLFF
ncbi:hypothetical protein BDFG_04304 [Blastomyces dermatitidis ATCC 26199]|nr:hypothetical protein BDFG_04304 [Blastomyces dermatitidis ATCC 26199]